MSSLSLSSVSDELVLIEVEGLSRSDLKKSVIVFCVFGLLGIVLFVVVLLAIAVWCGSAKMSSAIGGRFALTKKSRRFFGLL